MRLRHAAAAATIAAYLVAGSVAAASSGYFPVFASDGSKLYPYGHWQPSLTCAPLHVCDITLGRQESVLNVAVGDSVRWIVASAQSGPGGTTPHVFVKPTEYDLRTNLVVTTTRHTYDVDLSSAHDRGPSRIGFYYPEDEIVANAAASTSARLAAAAVAPATPKPSPAALDFKYRIYGDPSLAPHAVYNDGSHTYLMFASLPNDLPVPFAVAPDGSQQIVNYRLSETMIVIDGLPVGVDLVLNAGTGRHGRGERRAHVRRA